MAGEKRPGEKRPGEKRAGEKRAGEKRAGKRWLAGAGAGGRRTAWTAGRVSCIGAAGKRNPQSWIRWLAGAGLAGGGFAVPAAALSSLQGAHGLLVLLAVAVQRAGMP